MSGIDENDIAQQQRILESIQRANTVKVLKDRNRVRINTNFAKSEIDCIDIFPTGNNEADRKIRKDYKFYCPICLRYFNHILISDCCNNYICRFCIGWQAKKAKKEENYKI
jgi:hypothetical protein